MLPRGPSLDDYNAAQRIARAAGAAKDAYGFNVRGGAVAGGGTGGTGPGGTALPGTYNPASGGIPTTTPTGTSMADLLAGIASNIGALSPVIGDITAASNKALRDQYPGDYFDTLSTIGSNLGQRAKGNIDDLLPILQQNAGEWGVGQGLSGSPAASSKFLRDLGLTAYGVQREATEDMGKYQNLIPRVAPFDAQRLIPDIVSQMMLDDTRNIRGSAPIPEAAYQRARRDALEGINRGFGAGYGGGAGRGAAVNPSIGSIIGRYGGAMLPPNVATKPGGGWGQAWNDEGGFAQAGNVPDWAQGGIPIDGPGGSPLPDVGPAWEQNFDWMTDPFAGFEVPFAGNTPQQGGGMGPMFGHQQFAPLFEDQGDDYEIAELFY